MPKTTVQRIMGKKSQNEKICMITCYDATFAKIVDKAGADIVLVGDSLGTVIKGESSTLNVTLEEIAYHTRAVARGTQNPLIAADLPFLTYHRDDAQAIESAGTLIQSGANCVKLEGGLHLADRIRKIIAFGIPVMGHIGLLPQSVNAQGGYVIQGRTKDAKDKLIADALALQDAGVFSLVLEGVQSDVAEEITSRLEIPTIGIGAGAECDGQVLVLYDLLGLDPDFKPKFVKQFADGSADVQQACQNFIKEVKKGLFPSKDHTFLPPKTSAPSGNGAELSAH
jgi:3-methyl-2-oxobutanoate hydroxymethyltransferase